MLIVDYRYLVYDKKLTRIRKEKQRALSEDILSQYELYLELYYFT